LRGEIGAENRFYQPLLKNISKRTADTSPPDAISLHKYFRLRSRRRNAGGKSDALLKLQSICDQRGEMRDRKTFFRDEKNPPRAGYEKQKSACVCKAGKGGGYFCN